MLRHASSRNKSERLRRWAGGGLYVLLLLALAACGVAPSANSGGVAPVETLPAGTALPLPSPAPASSAQVATGIFAVDTLVRSQQLAGVDLHLRYAERTAAGLVLHLAFYNNGSQDL